MTVTGTSLVKESAESAPYCIGVVTRYLGPTNHRGSRIVATIPARMVAGKVFRATVAYDYSDSTRGNHANAVESVLRKYAAYVAETMGDDWQDIYTVDSVSDTPTGYVFHVKINYGRIA